MGRVADPQLDVIDAEQGHEVVRLDAGGCRVGDCWIRCHRSLLVTALVS